MALPSQQTGFQAAKEASERGATGSGVVFGAKREIGGSDPGKLNQAGQGESVGNSGGGQRRTSQLP